LDDLSAYYYLVLKSVLKAISAFAQEIPNDIAQLRARATNEFLSMKSKERHFEAQLPGIKEISQLLST
jgi:hypothetical protein